MLIVYDHSESVCCQKVRIALDEKGIETEHRIIKIEEGESHTPAYIAINPKGVVPAFVDEQGRTIDESTIMLEYLEDRYPDPPLMPKDPYWRAKRRLWARSIDEGMHVPHISNLSFIIAFSPWLKNNFGTQEKLDAYVNSITGDKLREFTRRTFATGLQSEDLRDSVIAYDKFLGEMEKQLSTVKWLAGDAFSLADIDVIPYIWRLRNLQLGGLWDKRPHVADWLDRVTRRPSFKSAVLDIQEERWLELMKANGLAAWPRIKEMLPA